MVNQNSLPGHLCIIQYRCFDTLIFTVTLHVNFKYYLTLFPDRDLHYTFFKLLVSALENIWFETTLHVPGGSYEESINIAHFQTIDCMGQSMLTPSPDNIYYNVVVNSMIRLNYNMSVHCSRHSNFLIFF